MAVRGRRKAAFSPLRPEKPGAVFTVSICTRRLASLLTERLPKFSGRSSRTQAFGSAHRHDKPCHSEPRRRRGTSQLQIAPPSCRKTCIAFERSFGALRQPQDDNLESALPIYRPTSKRDAKHKREARTLATPKQKKLNSRERPIHPPILSQSSPRRDARCG